jgi:putative nucleotidyltransferase with HDIG domain
MNRDEALSIVREYTKNENLVKHMLAVEAAMRAYARRYGEDEETWGIVGLLHDFDWEVHPDVAPDGHPAAGAPILRERGVPEDIIRSILSHATEVTGVERTTTMDRALYAVDELTGLITAVALVRPSRSLYDVDVAAVQKKWKDKAFARGAKREDIERGAADLGVPRDEHIGVVLKAMQGIAGELGLAGPDS